MISYAVKALGGGRIEGYAVRWGSPDEPDRSAYKDYFTPHTDLMLGAWGFPRPILVDHMVTPEAEAAGSVGKWMSATKDSVGVKMAGQLDTTHPMYGQLDRDIRAGRYFLSSDSAGHLVKRRRQPNGTHELERWGLLTASLTKTPAEHRLMPVATVKALALKAGAQGHIQEAHDRLVAAGAVCGPAGKSARQAALEDRLLELELDEEDRAAALKSRSARLWAELNAIEREVVLTDIAREQELLARLGRLQRGA